MTLAEKVKKNFSKVKVNKTAVKVPKLRLAKKKEGIPKRAKEEMPLSAIVSLFIKNAVEEAKKDPAGKDAKSESWRFYKAAKGEHSQEPGGYGAAAKNYSFAQSSSYTDYSKLFSYLGKFRARGAYESAASPDGGAAASGTNPFALISKETMETGARHVKYFMPKGSALDSISMVPIAGMGSGEWEQFKLWMKLDPVMYLLKTTTS